MSYEELSGVTRAHALSTEKAVRKKAGSFFHTVNLGLHTFGQNVHALKVSR